MHAQELPACLPPSCHQLHLVCSASPILLQLFSSPRPSRSRLSNTQGRLAGIPEKVMVRSQDRSRQSGKHSHDSRGSVPAGQFLWHRCCVRRMRVAAGQRVYPGQGQQHADITTASGEQRRQQQQQPYGHTGSGTGQQVGDDCPVRHMTRALFLPPCPCACPSLPLATLS